MLRRKISNASASYTAMGWVNVSWNVHDHEIEGLHCRDSFSFPPEVIDPLLRLLNKPDLGNNTWDWRYS